MSLVVNIVLSLSAVNQTGCNISLLVKNPGEWFILIIGFFFSVVNSNACSAPIIF